ncbi:MAG TPA: HAD-IIIA family hydrolase [Sulfurovum sp.]|nr:MAG: 3-deoxy-D-manno-octulosonate 8-phosphate phosphatase [Sulfurovum sp. 35-42-20]OYY55051.1 MAG: 3-deoxy-D-manno-octulosonate 8-phosphate phosphatase [Sulfurovum sp. 28-43-6]OYZ25389.1 MAG: 3-deoxy-D-manno-octulosonate 8-phosphate phosphatase [Sulfurovum sp. 16-42-52]OYZ49857.1 MAG: 3-deoxy-D-manno-octulosonate 8-phosphate phosphatase [Sulfurovum sp. 24-42-9]OZA45485.1 MAG: 3-deoxy-D-manno-octulosonate 8-phosphate phosphatase [Sulfurovum sp. 17-42-90]OZA59416.1 MAG: 3-deoxy-D-manno-octulo
MSIELIVLDVDGTMTDSRITYSANGDEIKSFNVKDGLAITSWRKLGKQVAIITGRSSAIVARRAKELQIEHFYQGIENKKEVLESLLVKLGLTMENVAAIGDDLNDLQMLKVAKLSFVPRDASVYVEKIATVVLSKKGGDGAVREMIEYLISQEGLEKKYVELWD